MKKSFVVLGGNFLFLSRARAKKKISERPDLTKTQERETSFYIKFISQTSTIIYREEDNRHK
jgi:hypothetical protein